MVIVKKTGRGIVIALGCATLASVCGPSCQRYRARPASLRASRTVYDTSPLDASAFGTDATSRARTLGMPAGELVARLHAFKLLAHSHFTLTHGSESVDQSDTYAWVQDGRGAFTVSLDTPHSQLEAHQIGEAVYVRYDKGSMRKKTRRDMDSEALRDVAQSVMPQALLACPGITFKNPQPDQVDGRPTTRYTLGQGTLAKDNSEPMAPSLALHLPMAPPPLWREHSRLGRVQGFVSIDTATGALLRGQIEAHLQVLDRGTSPTEIVIRCDVQITQVGRVADLAAPTRVLSEFRRPIRVPDHLHFFRDVVPRQPAAAPGAVP